MFYFRPYYSDNYDNCQDKSIHIIPLFIVSNIDKYKDLNTSIISRRVYKTNRTFGMFIRPVITHITKDLSYNIQPTLLKGNNDIFFSIVGTSYGTEVLEDTEIIFNFRGEGEVLPASDNIVFNFSFHEGE